MGATPHPLDRTTGSSKIFFAILEKIGYLQYGSCC